MSNIQPSSGAAIRYLGISELGGLQGPIPAAGLKVLVDDDLAINQQIVTLFLAGYGHTTDVAANGQEALHRLGVDGGHYDLVLMDIQMPIMDGVTATRAIRVLASPVLVHLSFNAEDTDVVAGVLAEILAGSVVRPPSPPFDPRYRWICCWDERGTIVELAPRGVAPALGPSGEIVFVEAPEEPRWSSSHVLLLSKVPLERIEELAATHGWQTGLVKNGRGFEVQNLWLENRRLVEFTTPELLPPYLDFFGAGNREHLDAQMRALEADRLAENTDSNKEPGR